MQKIRAIAIRPDHLKDNIQLAEIEVTREFIRMHTEVVGENPISHAGEVDDYHVAFCDDGLNTIPVVKYAWREDPIAGNVIIVGRQQDSTDAISATLTLNQVDSLIEGAIKNPSINKGKSNEAR